MSDSNENKNIAIAKIDSIIKQDVEALVHLCQKTSFLETSCFIYWLHLARGVASQIIDSGDKKLDSLWVTTSLVDESLKYLIQCSAKFGTSGQVNHQNYQNLNLPLAQDLLKFANRINAKFNSRELAKLFDTKIEHGRVKVNYDKPLVDPEASNFFDYYKRNELNNEFTKMNELNLHLDGLLTKFYEEHGGNDDLFKLTFGVSLQIYIDLHEYLVNTVIKQLQSYESQMPMISPGRIDVQSAGFYMLYTQSSYIQISEVEHKFGPMATSLINQLTFKPTNFNEHQLRYHQLSRAPIISLPDGYIQVCPDFLLDSLFINSHYSLLESQKDVKEEYKIRSAEKFINEIAKVCAKHGFVETQRNLDLFDGKRNLGDIDLVVKSVDGEQILIEAKNHVLPLDVYFYDSQAAKKHLEYLQLNWERPLLGRIKHLEEYSDKYDIHPPYRYLVVSQMPEIISHFSDNLFLSIYEFEGWLKNRDTWTRFSDVFQALYRISHELTEKDIHNFQEAGFLTYD